MLLSRDRRSVAREQPWSIKDFHGIIMSHTTRSRQFQLGGFEDPGSLGFVFVAVLVGSLLTSQLGNLLSPEKIGATRSATCTFEGDGTGTLGGTITISEGDSATASYTGTITGLTAGQQHGIHVHQNGDTGGNCDSAGGHYNPDMAPHGMPSSPSTDRHIGDLGNILANGQGDSTFSLSDNLALLSGKYSIINRAIVVHAGPDLFEGAAGNAGARLGCCVITQV